jgi:uncharacterized protein
LGNGRVGRSFSLLLKAGLRDQMGLTNQEIEELDAFLLSDDGRENAMDVSGVDGFLCAVLSGPNVIMPSEWMRWVWDSAEGKQSPEFTSEKQAQRILDLLMRHANANAGNVARKRDTVAPHTALSDTETRRVQARLAFRL